MSEKTQKEAASKSTVEIIELLNNAVKNEEMKYRNDSSLYFKLLMGRYPISNNRIDWKKVPDRISLYPTNEQQTSSFDMQGHLEKVDHFFKKVVKKMIPSSDDNVVLIGDGAIDGAYLMNLSVLEKYLCFICMISQHSYIMPSDGSWCLNYSMEDDLYFGFAPKQ